MNLALTEKIHISLTTQTDYQNYFKGGGGTNSIKLVRWTSRDSVIVECTGPVSLAQQRLMVQALADYTKAGYHDTQTLNDERHDR